MTNNSKHHGKIDGRYAGDGPPNYKQRSGRRGDDAERHDRATLLKVADALDHVAQALLGMIARNKALWLTSTAIKIRRSVALAKGANSVETLIDAGFEARELRREALDWLEKEAAEANNPERRSALNRAAAKVKDLKPTMNIRLAQTAKEAEGARRKTVKHLRKAAATEPDDDRKQTLLEIADTLTSCGPRPRRWCRHGMCPFCARTLQRWFTDAAQEALLKQTHSGTHQDVSFMSWMLPERLTLNAGMQHIKDTVAEIDKRAKQALEDAGITRFLGGYDFSVNVDLDGSVRIQAQIWAAGIRHELEAARKEMKAAFAPKRYIKQPVKTYPWDGYGAAWNYANKTRFYRRVSKPPQEDADKRSTQWRNTEKQPLNATETAALALVLDALGMDRRLVLVGYEVDRTGMAKIVPTAIESEADHQKAAKLVRHHEYDEAASNEAEHKEDAWDAANSWAAYKGF